MLFLILFGLIVITICVRSVWLGRYGSWTSPIERAVPASPAASAKADGYSVTRPESLEGVLVAQLMAGEITRGQYLRGVEGLAARDEKRHPLTVPPGTGPSDD
jgi:hypothetical protein